MKFFIAIIKPSRLEDVWQALSNIGAPETTVTEVKGFGRQKDTRNSIVVWWTCGFLPKNNYEIAFSPDTGEHVIEIVLWTAGSERSALA